MLFYILNFKTHDFISCNSANNVVVSIRNLLEQGAHENDLEIINGLGEEVRFTVDEFSDYCKTLSLVDQAGLDLFSLALEKEGDLRGYRSADADVPTYPHDFGNGYKIQKFYANLLPAVYVNDVGDIYDVKEDAEADYPDADIVIGFRVVCDIPGRDPFPEGCKPFCKTVEEAIADYEKHVLPMLPKMKLKAGMVGIIKDDPDIKKAWRGKAFVITEVIENSLYATCSIEGKQGNYAVAKYNMENLSMPADKVKCNLSLAAQIEDASNRTNKNIGAEQAKENEISR